MPYLAEIAGSSARSSGGGRGTQRPAVWRPNFGGGDCSGRYGTVDPCLGAEPAGPVKPTGRGAAPGRRRWLMWRGGYGQDAAHDQDQRADPGMLSVMSGL